MARQAGSVIREWRTEQGLTQEWLADKTGIRQSYLSALEKGRSAEPGVFRLARIVRVLGHTVDELVRECLKDESTAARRQPAAA